MLVFFQIYIVNFINNDYTQCSDSISGIESDSCTTISTAPDELSSPTAIVINKTLGYAYILDNVPNRDHLEYTKCSLLESSINYTDCHNYSVANPWYQISAGQLVFHGQYAYIMSLYETSGVGDYWQCSLINSTIYIPGCAVRTNTDSFVSALAFYNNYAYLVGRSNEITRCPVDDSGIMGRCTNVKPYKSHDFSTKHLLNTMIFESGLDQL